VPARVTLRRGLAPTQSSGALLGSGADRRLQTGRVTVAHCRRAQGRAGWNVGLVVLSATMVAVSGYGRRFICDDGLIYVRTVREILAGNGPVFSPGERAEASTSTLWQWFLALLGWVSGADIAELAVFAGLVLTVAGFALAVDGTRRMQLSQRDRLLLPGGIALLLALPPVWDYATSGLETRLSHLLDGSVLVDPRRPGQGPRPGDRCSSGGVRTRSAGAPRLNRGQHRVLDRRLVDAAALATPKRAGAACCRGSTSGLRSVPYGLLRACCSRYPL